MRKPSPRANEGRGATRTAATQFNWPWLPGESETVTFVVPMSVLGYTGVSGEFIMEPGPVEVSAGSSSTDNRSSATLTVTGEARAISGENRAFLSVARFDP